MAKEMFLLRKMAGKCAVRVLASKGVESTKMPGEPYIHVFQTTENNFDGNKISVLHVVHQSRGFEVHVQLCSCNHDTTQALASLKP